jgi:hypothetical protein
MAEDPKAAAPVEHDRRGFLRGSAVAATAVAAAASLEAQPGRAPGRLPANTPITKLGFNDAELAQMTAAVKKLTKGDLLELREWQAKGDTKDAPLHLSIADMNSLQQAFHSMDVRQHQGLQAQDNVSCCCCSCTPCCSCCAAADIA